VPWTLETNGWTILTWKNQMNRASEHCCDLRANKRAVGIVHLLYFGYIYIGLRVMPMRNFQLFGDHAKCLFGLLKPAMVQSLK